MAIDKTALLVATNWNRRRGHGLTEHEVYTLAETVFLRWNGVSYPALDDLYDSKRAAARAVEAAKPKVVDKQACRTLLGMTVRYGGVDANVGILAGELESHGLDPTLDNFKLILPELERQHKLVVSESYRRAFDEFFQKCPQFERNEANHLLMERALRGADVTFENLLDLTDVGNPDFIGDRLSLSAEGIRQQTAERQAKHDDAEKKSLVSQLTSHLVDSNNVPLRSIARGTRSPRMVYAAEVARLESLSLSDLRQLAANRTENQRLQSLSTEQLREEARRNFAPQQAQQSQRYAPIPPRYVPPGKTEECGVNWSALLLKYLPKTETDRLMKIYGPEQLDAVVAAGRKQAVTQ